jgi:hypothetical protein
MAEGYSQHGCHGAAPGQHSPNNAVTEKEELWDNPAADGVSNPSTVNRGCDS